MKYRTSGRNQASGKWSLLAQNFLSGGIGQAWQQWNDSVMNKVDDSRIRTVGPDRACAEWLLKCGAKVKWKNASHWEKDYNTLPGGSFDKYKIEEIDATGSVVMFQGMVHLKGLKDVNKIIFCDCRYLYNSDIDFLRYTKNSLQHLEISKCGRITESGLIQYLSCLTNLKTLKLSELPGVKNPEMHKLLTEILPNCDINCDV